MITAGERQNMMRAYSIGPKMVDYLERSGIEKLADLVGRDPQSLILQIEVETGVRLNKMGLDALANLVELANETA